MANYKTPEDELSDLYLADVDQIDQFISGELYVWGNNQYGNLGRNNTTSSISPIQTISGGNDWIQVSSGEVHIAAIKADGNLWSWGYNSDGRVGDNTTINKSSPVLIGSDFKEISCCTSTSGIKRDGSLWTWGYGGYGTLASNALSNRSSPAQTVAGGNNWKTVSNGYLHAGSIKTDGTLWIWGRNDSGNLGTLDSIHRSSPIQTVATGSDWKQISCGYLHTAAIKNDGSLWLWGDNTYGQLGDSSISNKSSPVQTIAGGNNWKSVAALYFVTIGVKTDGTLWAWGHNSLGQVGDGTIIHRSSPVLIGSGWKDVIRNSSLTSISAAIKEDGSLWAWGDSSKSNIGDGTSSNRSSPVQVLGIGSTWKQVSMGWWQNAMIVVKE